MFKYIHRVYIIHTETDLYILFCYTSLLISQEVIDLALTKIDSFLTMFTPRIHHLRMINIWGRQWLTVNLHNTNKLINHYWSYPSKYTCHNYIYVKCFEDEKFGGYVIWNIMCGNFYIYNTFYTNYFLFSKGKGIINFTLDSRIYVK